MRPRHVLVPVAIAAAAFAAVTLTALEGNEVAVLRTRDASGDVRETRVWVAEEQGSLWIEAATPERPFYLDLLADPRAELERSQGTLLVVARPEPGDDGHRHVRALLRAKYGWADRFVALLQDTSRSVAVRLEREPGSREAPAT